MNIKECIDKGFLKKGVKDTELAKKELKEAEYDLSSAKKAFSDSDYKWCIVKCYYSMFHSAKAVLFSLGFIEKKHIAILIVLEDLSRRGILNSSFVTDFKASMTAREDADYHYSHSKETAEYEIELADNFISEMKKQMNKPSIN